MSNHNRYSEIEPGLWIGACPGGESPLFAQAILNLFGLTAYDVRCAAYREERLLDLDVPDEEVLESLVDWVHEQREQGRTVLVHCQEGRNRSALVVALYLRRHRDMRAVDAIQLIRESRGSLALYNGTFVRYLQSLDPPLRARIVDMGPDWGARFLVYLDERKEPSSAHQARWAAERWITTVARVHGYEAPTIYHE